MGKSRADERMSANELVLASTVKYFAARPNERAALAAMVEGQADVSLRLLDWFLTHYVHARNVLYWIDDHAGTVQDDYPAAARDPARVRKCALSQCYRAQLRAFTKAAFDPFRRHGRVTFVVSDGPKPSTVETTVGQLNFFRWAFQNRVIDYVRLHLADLELAMAAFMTQRRAARTKPAKHRASGDETNGKNAAASSSKTSAAAAAAARIAGNTYLSFD